MLIVPDSTSESRRIFENAIADKFKITMLVIGDEKGMDQIASRADVRAGASPWTRRVVWIRDPRVLAADEYDTFTRSGSCVVCALDLDDQPRSWLSVQDAQRFTKLELAFLDAERLQ